MLSFVRLLFVLTPTRDGTQRWTPLRERQTLAGVERPPLPGEDDWEPARDTKRWARLLYPNGGRGAHPDTVTDLLKRAIDADARLPVGDTLRQVRAGAESCLSSTQCRTSCAASASSLCLLRCASACHVYVGRRSCLLCWHVGGRGDLAQCSTAPALFLTPPHPCTRGAPAAAGLRSPAWPHYELPRPGEMSGKSQRELETDMTEQQVAEMNAARALELRAMSERVKGVIIQVGRGTLADPPPPAARPPAARPPAAAGTRGNADQHRWAHALALPLLPETVASAAVPARASSQPERSQPALTPAVCRRPCAAVV